MGKSRCGSPSLEVAVCLDSWTDLIQGCKVVPARTSDGGMDPSRRSVRRHTCWVEARVREGQEMRKMSGEDIWIGMRLNLTTGGLGLLVD